MCCVLSVSSARECPCCVFRRLVPFRRAGWVNSRFTQRFGAQVRLAESSYAGDVVPVAKRSHALPAAAGSTVP